MKNKTIKVILIIALTIILMTLSIPRSLALSPGDITGDVGGDTSIDVEFVTKLEDMIRLIGIFIAVGAMMIIGIKYMTGSIEEKANYKKTMMPYLIGCILLFGASTIAPKIIETFKESQTAEDIGNTVLGLIQTIGTFVAVAVLMIIGIKYMLGSSEERASYKKTMLPYLIGAVLLFGAVNITAMIANNISTEDSNGGTTAGENHAKGKTDALAFVSAHVNDQVALNNEYQKAKANYEAAKKAESYDKTEVQYWNTYANEIQKALANLTNPSF